MEKLKWSDVIEKPFITVSLAVPPQEFVATYHGKNFILENEIIKEKTEGSFNKIISMALDLKITEIELDLDNKNLLLAISINPELKKILITVMDYKNSGFGIWAMIPFGCSMFLVPNGAVSSVANNLDNNHIPDVCLATSALEWMLINKDTLLKQKKKKINILPDMSLKLTKISNCPISYMYTTYDIQRGYQEIYKTLSNVADTVGASSAGSISLWIPIDNIKWVVVSSILRGPSCISIIKKSTDDRVREIIFSGNIKDINKTQKDNYIITILTQGLINTITERELLNLATQWQNELFIKSFNHEAN